MFNKIIISKSNLINNVKQVKKHNPCSKICAMIKANAYGVGAEQVVKIIEHFVDYFGVACFFEAQQVENWTEKDILIVGALEKEFVSERFCYTVSSIEDVQNLITIDKPIKIHLKINTGMNRFGFNGVADLRKSLKLIKNSKLILQGIFTHFATADNFINIQMKRFLQFVKVAKKFKSDLIVHADNSIVNEIKNHNLDMVRIGFDLYNKSDKFFKPVVKIKSRIVQVNKIKKGDLIGYNYRFVANKNMCVAVVPIGYADGFGLEYIGYNLNVDNVNCKVLNVCMDCFLLDVTNLKIKKGDEIYLLNENNSLAKFANFAKTSDYQIMTNFSHMRAIRIFED